MAIVVSRSETQLAATGAFQAMDNLGTSSVSSSFTVPSNVSSIKQIAIAVTADGSEEFVPLVKISGNTMRDGDAVFNCGGLSAMPSSVGSTMMYVNIDTDLAVQAGNSVSFEIATTSAATIDCVTTAQFP